jgi:DAK2 domain fusion protein YloV
VRVPEVLDAPTLRHWCALAADALERAREAIDGLNVYPVPDADTGTNLAYTVRAVADAAAEAPSDSGLPRLTARLARAALTDARGNSGVILSQLLLGAGEVIAEDGPCDGDRLRRALRRGADQAWKAVTVPVEGTVLTVARAAADAAEAAPPKSVAGVVVAAAVAGAAEALAHTPEQLPVLAEAGVVDAGGLGFLILIDALLTALTDAPMPDRTSGLRRSVTPARAGAATVGPGYEVMYLLAAEEDAIPGLRAALAPLGDSLLVVGGGGLWNVHVHVDDVGAAIEAGVDAGRPHRIRVTRFADAAGGAAEVEARSGRAVVALSPGGGLRELLEAEGAVVVDGRPAAVPVPEAVLAAIDATRAAEVVVLPNDREAVPVAREAADLARAIGIAVAVVPTRSSVQGLAALAVRDERRRFDDEVIAMSAAAAATRYGEVTFATGRALTSVGVCEEGDVLGLVDGDVAVIGTTPFDVGAGVLDRLLIGGGELATLVIGADADHDLGSKLLAYLRSTRPAVEPVLLHGGQSEFPLLIGVE